MSSARVSAWLALNLTLVEENIIVSCHNIALLLLLLERRRRGRRVRFGAAICRCPSRAKSFPRETRIRRQITRWLYADDDRRPSLEDATNSKK